MILENNLLIDFHTHILPNMDDGPKDLETSICMLKESKQLGIDHIVLTPHFYADEEYPESFLKRRENACSLLKSSLEDTFLFPTLSLGAEVAYFKGMGMSSNIKDLVIVETNHILVEMPYYTKWTNEMIEDILNITKKQKINVILAHVNRYFKDGFNKYADMLKENGVLFQWNGEAFLLGDKKESLKYFEKGYVDLLGSDTHSMHNRPQNLNDVKNVLVENNLPMFNKIIQKSNSLFI